MSNAGSGGQVAPASSRPVRALWRLLAFLRPYRLVIALAPLLMVGEVSADLLQPRLMQTIIDRGIIGADMALVVRTGLLMLGLALAGAVCGLTNTLIVVPMTQAVAADVRGALFRKVQSLSLRNFDALGTGNLITRLTNDVQQIQNALLSLMRIFIRAPLILLGSIVLAVMTCPSLTPILLVLLPVLVVVVVVFFKKSHRMFVGIQGALDQLNGVTQENIAGVRVVKAFGRAEYEQGRFGRSNEDLTRRTMRAMQFTALVMPLMMMAVSVGVAAAYWYGGRAVIGGSLQIGAVVAFSNYLQRTLMSLTLVATVLVRISRAGASAGRIVEVLDTEPDVQDSPHAVAGARLRGRVEFRHVTFRYQGAPDPALQDVSFTAEPGQTVALLGATGSGKSTLVHLIPRFYDVEAGQVLVDGLDVRDLPKKELRARIGLALQESVLFSGTIGDNIRYGRPEASDQEVMAAARVAQAHEFVSSFPEGYDTILGQRGVNLSGGQKQRIAIARALLVRPAVLILDDSTSAVDVETEARIEEAMRDLMRESTSIVIAQRISTVLNADKILVLDGGRLAAEGTHPELLVSSPLYREIYDSQLGGASASADAPASAPAPQAGGAP
jgi:ATP-binding cassette subfamily B multidrug efflux pump